MIGINCDSSWGTSSFICYKQSSFYGFLYLNPKSQTLNSIPTKARKSYAIEYLDPLGTSPDLPQQSIQYRGECFNYKGLSLKQLPTKQGSPKGVYKGYYKATISVLCIGGLNHYLYHFGGSLLQLQYSGPQTPNRVTKVPTVSPYSPYFDSRKPLGIITVPTMQGSDYIISRLVPYFAERTAYTMNPYMVYEP